jgi:hypothetical protein
VATHLFQLAQKNFLALTIFSSFLVPKLWGHFEGLNEGFLGSSSILNTKDLIEPPK